MKLSFFELYNDMVVDLLSEKKTSKVFETERGQVVAKDLTEETILSADEALCLLKRGEALMHYSATACNAHSSRSHIIFCVVIESNEKGV